MKSEETKQRIVEQTILLIQESNGLTENITIRQIAEKANVGVGLINHYFGTKDNLMEECVQSLIVGVIGAFHPPLIEGEDAAENAGRAAKLVMDFLMENPEPSKISILGDLKKPDVLDNTMRTLLGLGRRLSDGNLQPGDKIRAFFITAVMQVAFLRKDVLFETLGIDLYDKAQRDAFLNDLMERFG